MEIERKYLITCLPKWATSHPFHRIEQAYLNTEPVVRIRQEDDTYYLTCKSKGLMVREEYNLPLTREAYEHLRTKADGNILTKTRYRIPLASSGGHDGDWGGGENLGDCGVSPGLTIELDVFHGIFEGLVLAEVEFSTKEQALAFTPPEWFGEDVTFCGTYQNSRLSQLPPDGRKLV